MEGVVQMKKTKKHVDLNNQFLEQAVFAIADGYCSINLTKDVVPEVMHQIVDGVNYDLNEQLGMPENSSYTELVDLWALTIPEEGRDEFLKVMNRENLLECFRNGERHISVTYWTRTAKYEPMLAEDHMAIFTDEETGEVLAVNYVLDRTEQHRLKQYEKELEQKNRQLEAMLETEKKYSSKLYHDALTGTFNRRYYEEVVHNFSGTAGVALIDLDDFKIYNDTYGHQAGDRALEVAASAILSCIRPTDMLIRYGGDEFLLILTGIPSGVLRAKLEQIRDRVHDSVVPGYSQLYLSVSAGGVIKTTDSSMGTAVSIADKLMYQAKEMKDAVVVNEVRTDILPHDSSLEDTRQQILLVDDSELNRELLSEILGKDYRIMEAENGQEGLDKLYENQGDIALVLLDINMPVMDGFEVLHAMNTSHIIEDIPVIMISSDASEDVIRKSYELGASDYVNRPFDARIVYRRVTNTIKLYTKQRRLVKMVSNQIKKQQHDTATLVGVLSQIVEFRNGESGSHVRHIRIITELLLNRLLTITNQYHITSEEQTDIALASSLHDIGKIAIDEKILNKPGRLTDEEFEIMKTHSMQGAEMIARLENYKEEPLLHTAYEIARWHHERWDGRGYPDGLKENEIPISAQIVSMADVYDALTSERCYKKAFSHEKAIQMIQNGECGTFNPLLLQCLNEVQNELKAELQNDYVDTY